ncbi:MAG: ABC transporter ATP-binding protein [Bacillota bacterium]|nr:branched-chain amino acid ABC transporter ATP-binding protein [Bacillota bacterium]REJ36045.1 MAG: branched-chain amino acid ABC transporter ATP-binding protein [Bacillota bacterium]
MLALTNVKAGYGQVPVVHDVTLEVRAGEMVSLIGANGAGKSTILKTIMGAVRPLSGQVHFLDEDITGRPTPDIVRRGIVYVPEGKLVFEPLTVEENLRLGAYLVNDKQVVQERLERAYALFPRLAERRNQRAGTLSGGERTMLAIARGLMSGPRLLMLDEPSLGLMPKLVTEMFATIAALKKTGLAILLVEQRAREALELADRGYVLRTGRIVASGSAAELLSGEVLVQAFLGR